MYIFETIFATILLQTYLDRIKWSDKTSKPKAAGVQSTEVAPFSTQNTNKDDKARLIHMLNSPAFSSKFTSAHQVMNRAELDDKACHGEHWNDLAASFNDYEGEK